MEATTTTRGKEKGGVVKDDGKETVDRVEEKGGTVGSEEASGARPDRA